MAKFLMTTRGGQKLVFNGYGYVKDGKGEMKNGKLRWYCDNRHSAKCKAGVYTAPDVEENCEVEEFGIHTHESDTLKFEIIAALNALKKKATETTESPTEIVEEIIASVSPEAAVKMPTMESLKRFVRNWRQTDKPHTIEPTEYVAVRHATVHFGLSIRDRPKLICDGYGYVKGKELSEGRIAWVCDSKVTMTCKACAYTTADVEEGGLAELVGDHTHQPKVAKLDVTVAKNALKRKAIDEATSDTTADIVNEFVASIEPIVAMEEMPAVESLKRFARRWKSSARKALVRDQNVQPVSRKSTSKSPNVGRDRIREQNRKKSRALAHRIQAQHRMMEETLRETDEVIRNLQSEMEQLQSMGMETGNMDQMREIMQQVRTKNVDIIRKERSRSAIAVHFQAIIDELQTQLDECQAMITNDVAIRHDHESLVRRVDDDPRSQINESIIPRPAARKKRRPQMNAVDNEDAIAVVNVTVECS